MFSSAGWVSEAQWKPCAETLACETRLYIHSKQCQDHRDCVTLTSHFAIVWYQVWHHQLCDTKCDITAALCDTKCDIIGSVTPSLISPPVCHQEQAVQRHRFLQPDSCYILTVDLQCLVPANIISVLLTTGCLRPNINKAPLGGSTVPPQQTRC